MTDARPFSRQFHAQAPGALIDALAAAAPLSKSLLKKVLAAGGVWLRRGTGKWSRVRRAQLALSQGDEVALYYDPAALVPPAAAPTCLWQCSAYGVFYKPPGMPTQATRAGDRVDLIYQISQHRGKPALAVHRLDTAAAGLLLVAFTNRAAAQLSEQFQQRDVRKCYQARVAGAPPTAGSWNTAIDGKPALTHFWTLRPAAVSEVLIEIETGRHHQIRRHFAAAGHALVGDKRYGGPSASTLALTAVLLEWQCPLENQARSQQLPAELRLFAELSPP